MKAFFKSLAKIAFAGVIVFWLIQSGKLDISAVRETLYSQTYVICILIFFAILVLNNTRWWVLFKGQNIIVGWPRLFVLTLIGMFFNYMIPSGVGGDVVKGYYLFKDSSERRTLAVTSILLDRIIGLVGFFNIALIAIVLRWQFVQSKPELVALALSVVLAYLFFVGFFFVCYSEKLAQTWIVRKVFELPLAGHRLKLLYDALHSYSRKPQYLLGSFIISFVSQSLIIVIFWLAGIAMGAVELSFFDYAFAGALGLVAMALPVAPAGVGVGQVAFLVLFGWMGASTEQLGPNIITVFQLVGFAWGLVGGVVYVIYKPRNTKS
jgi:uncharacterized protein (TIRG00374 family)